MLIKHLPLRILPVPPTLLLFSSFQPCSYGKLFPTVTECLRWEGTSGVHLVQLLCLRKISHDTLFSHSIHKCRRNPVHLGQEESPVWENNSISSQICQLQDKYVVWTGVKKGSTISGPSLPQKTKSSPRLEVDIKETLVFLTPLL